MAEWFAPTCTVCVAGNDAQQRLRDAIGDVEITRISERDTVGIVSRWP